MNNPPSTLPPLPRHLDRVCDRFEEAWRRTRAGEPRPRLEAFLADVEGLELQTLLLELIGLDADYRRRLGETPKAEDYQPRFPTCRRRGWPMCWPPAAEDRDLPLCRGNP